LRRINPLSQVIEARYLEDEDAALRRVGAELGICAETVRRVEMRALEKMSRALRPRLKIGRGDIDARAFLAEFVMYLRLGIKYLRRRRHPEFFKLRWPAPELNVVFPVYIVGERGDSVSAENPGMNVWVWASCWRAIHGVVFAAQAKAMKEGSGDGERYYRTTSDCVPQGRGKWWLNKPCWQPSRVEWPKAA
jgi:hypothetical protein